MTSNRDQALNVIRDDMITIVINQVRKFRGSATFYEKHFFVPNDSLLMHEVEEIVPELQQLGYKIQYNTTIDHKKVISSWSGKIIKSSEEVTKSITIKL